MKIKKPWLIQRVMEKVYYKNSDTPISPTFDQAYMLDYMGSAEFEFGAIPNSFTRILNNLEKFDFINLDIKNWKGDQLLVLYNNELDIKSYQEYLQQLSIDQLRLKEWTHFPQQVSGKNWKGEKLVDQSIEMRTIMWWDVENDIFFCFGQDRIHSLVEVLRNSLEKRNRKEKPNG